eukprot:1160296-Pelagomonas_calceolata.AAC.2
MPFSEAACIYNTLGKCVSTLTAQRLSTLTEAFEAAKQAGLHNTLQPSVQDMATEIMDLLQRLKAKNKHLLAKSKKPYRSAAWFPWKGAPTLLTLTPPTRTTSAPTLVTRSSELALMPSQCATLDTPSVIPSITMKSCFNSCTTRFIPPFKPIHQLQPSYYYPTGGAPAAMPT